MMNLNVLVKILIILHNLNIKTKNTHNTKMTQVKLNQLMMTNMTTS